METKRTSAQAVSNFLRRAGFAVGERYRHEGIGVSRGYPDGTATVAVSIIGNPKLEQQMVEDAANALRDGGFQVRAVEGSPILYVSK